MPGGHANGVHAGTSLKGLRRELQGARAVARVTDGRLPGLQEVVTDEKERLANDHHEGVAAGHTVQFEGELGGALGLCSARCLLMSTVSHV